MIRYTAHFETTTKAPVRVWAWGVSQIDNPEYFDCGYDIDGFIDFLGSLPQNSTTMYIHNEKVEGFAIIDYLMKNGWTWKEDSKQCTEPHTFTTIIDGMGKWYALDLFFDILGTKKKHVKILDSMKLFRLDIDDLANTFHSPIEKCYINVIAHSKCSLLPMSFDEEKYMRSYVKALAICLHTFLGDQEIGCKTQSSITIGAYALRDYKNFLGGDKHFKNVFPQLPQEVDRFCRIAYRGGFSNVNEEKVGQTIGQGLSLDLNNMYPYVMAACMLPYDLPVWFNGDYPKNEKYPLYIMQVRCKFKLKPGHIPIIQFKDSQEQINNVYMHDSGKIGDDLMPCILTVTSVDLELYQQHYDFTILECLGGYMFKASKALFYRWIKKWSDKRKSAYEAGNDGIVKICKTILNNLSGKFGTTPTTTAKEPILKGKKIKLVDITYPEFYEDGTPKLNGYGQQSRTKYKHKNPVYVPIAAFITSYARMITITTAQAIHAKSLEETGQSRWLYCDTDSVHIEGTEPPRGLQIDPIKLGYWKIENTFTRAKYLGAKRYIQEITEEEQTHLKVVCSGLQEEFHSEVTFENFREGQTYTKLMPKIVEGGLIFEKTKYMITGNGHCYDNSELDIIGHTWYNK